MTRTSSARIAGAMFLLYIAIGIASMIVARGSSAGETVAERLVSISQHLPQVRISMLLGLITGFIALTLAVALYGFTRDEDHELALLGLVCRIGEGLAIFVPILATLGLISLATGAVEAGTDAHAVADLLFQIKRWNVILAATFFAVGSTLFCWLLLRGRMIPLWLAWLGVFASVLLVVTLPMQLAGILRGTLAQLMWLPMAAFEVPLGIWLLRLKPS